MNSLFPIYHIVMINSVLVIKVLCYGIHYLLIKTTNPLKKFLNVLKKKLLVTIKVLFIYLFIFIHLIYFFYQMMKFSNWNSFIIKLFFTIFIYFNNCIIICF